MSLTLTALLTDLILIPVFWLTGSSVRIYAYTFLALANAVVYVILMTVFFVRIRRNEKRHGHALWFVLNQLFVLTVLFLFKITDLLLRHANA